MYKKNLFRFVALPLFILFVGLASTICFGASGDLWILPIDHLVGGDWTEQSGAGYNGTSAWEASGIDADRRVYWTLNQAGIPTTTELYRIEFYYPTAGATNWQPIESQFNGVNGETWPTDSNIPWAGAFGTNHQYIGAEGTGAPGTWVSTGPGPHTPESAAYSAGSNGIYMWLKQGSWALCKVGFWMVH